MPNTLLSLNKANKLRTPFVQGKHNMGGTGVLRFCGEKGFNLILSRKNPNICNDDDPTSLDWGFTIIRREYPDRGERSSVFKYLAPSGKILSFKADSLPILPGKYPQPYEEPMEYGTFIKLFNYQLPKKLRDLILLSLIHI